MRSLGEPLGGPGPFKASLTFNLPKALRPRGAEWQLPRLGLPPLPRAIQKRGRPRRLPVDVAAGPAWDYEAVLNLAAGRAPVTPRATLETPFRSVTWSAVPQDGTWTLKFHQDSKNRPYPFEEREKGVEEKREDWKRTVLFMDDALALEVSR
jgi:hypothetical protein